MQEDCLWVKTNPSKYKKLLENTTLNVNNPGIVSLDKIRGYNSIKYHLHSMIEFRKPKEIIKYHNTST